MSNGLLFPSLVGQGWTVHKKPRFDVRVAPHATGREARAGKYAMPMWDFELVFDGLDMTTTGDYGALGAQSMQTLAGFFLQCQGKANPFVYVDPTDNLVTNATIGVGDGVTTTFALSRPMGEFSEPVGALISVTGVYFNGAPVFGWIVAQPNTVTFGSPPPAGTVITGSFKFGFACRFTEDVADFEEFMAMLSAVKTLTFQSVRDIVPFEITALRTIVIDFPVGAGEFCAPADWNNNYNRVIAIGGGGGGGHTPGAGGGGGACTYRDNVHLDVGQCVPIVIGEGGPPHGPGSDWGLPGVPTTFHNPDDPDYIYADAAGVHAVGFAGASWGGLGDHCIPPGQSGGDGMTVQSFAAGCNGGGGAGGPFGPGGNGGSCYTNGTQSGAGGGGADGGATAEDPPAADYNIGLIVPGFNVATAGGAARDGTPGGAPGAIDSNPAAGVNGPGGAGKNGSGGGGGGGGLGGVNGSDGVVMYGFGDGGDGSTEPLWFADGVWYGPGSGGGGAGGALSFFDGGFAGKGGDGGKFGGGGGGGGGTISPGVDGNGGKLPGKGGNGGLIIIYLGLETSS